MEWIKIGALIKPFGLKGEMKVYSMTDFEENRFKKGNTIYMAVGTEKIPLKIASYRVHKNQPIVSFENYQDINLVEKYNKAELFVRKEDLHALPKGEYYVFQLKGLKAIDQAGNLIGEVIDVEETGAHNVLRIARADQKEVLVPYVEAFVKDVDLKKQEISIEVIEGLL